MAILKSALRACVLATAGLLAQGEAAAQFNQFYFFGDSLTDCRIVQARAPSRHRPLHDQSRSDLVASAGAALRLYGNPANQGGNDYAEGGARVSQLPGVSEFAADGNGYTVTDQISSFPRQGSGEPGRALRGLGGANDLFMQLDLLSAGAITPAQAQAVMVIAATQLGDSVAILNFRRRSPRHAIQPAGHRQDAAWRGIQPIGDRLGADALLQQHADGDGRRAESASDPPEHIRPCSTKPLRIRARSG